MDTLKVVIDKENQTMSVHNNGRGIPIEIHETEGVYIPELIFGHLLTSSNYDDDQKKVTGGRNGFGAKLCNIFSTEFTVETADKNTGKKYKQTWYDNMSRKCDPKISANPRKEEYTKVTFKPDLEKFGMSEFDDDLDALLKKRVYDMAGCVRDIKVFLNDERIKVRNFKQYIDLYLEEKDTEGGSKKPTVIHEVVNDRWEIAFAVSDGQFQQVSFVNSVCTVKGGTHCNYIADQLVTKLIEAVKKKNKAAPVKPFQVKNHLWIFVNALIENPAFDSQTKDTLTLRHTAFGSKCVVGDEFTKKVLKTEVVQNILNWAKFKEDQLLKRTDGGKKASITGIPKLEDANNAGTRRSSKCTLILTEGDSASALAVSGLGSVGRDNFGVFPLRGKLLNVREAAHTQIINNAEIQNIKQILGLKHGQTYSSVESLRYGHLMIMTDQDYDGSHIKGLIINWLDHFFPSLLNVPGFLVEFITPIVKVTKGKQERSFFTIPEYERWKEGHGHEAGWTIKYYKGLGTSTNADAKKYFGNLDKHMKTFQTVQPGDRDLIDMAFSKKKADARKEWLRTYKPGTHMDHDVEEIPMADFINKELILFSMADNIRSIPSLVDGLKPGQRKVMFGLFERKQKGEIKVAQLAGKISEKSAYHHGEVSLMSTIVGLANNFVGSNNINLLVPSGQFGTRLKGGKDAASPRYIFTQLSPLARALFSKSDDRLLNYLTDDGKPIEPEWYIPILPMILVNGSEGIGTGWSSSIPNYNPQDIVDNIRRLMKGEEMMPMLPWYRGFKGYIEQIAPDKVKISGRVSKLNETTVEITELPIRTWTQTYKEQLESWRVGTDKVPPMIKGYKGYHTDTTVHFVIEMSEKALAEAEAEGLEKVFKTSTTQSLSNMVCFDKAGRIRKYESPEEILQDFYDLRLEYYVKRKEYLADQLNAELDKLSNQARFVQMIIDDKLIISKRKKTDIVDELRQLKFKAIPKVVKAKIAGDDDDDEDDSEETTIQGDSMSDYDYLLGMAISSLTQEKVAQLLSQRDGKKAELHSLLKLSSKDLWNADLDEFTAQWDAAIQQDAADDKSHARSKNFREAVLATSKARGKMAKDSDSEASDDDFMISKAKPRVVSKSKAMPMAKATAAASRPAAVTAPKLTNSAPASRDLLDDLLSDDDLKALAASVKPKAQSDISSLTKATAKISLVDDNEPVKPKKKPVLKKPVAESSDDLPAPKRAPAKKAATKKAPAKSKIIESEEEEDFEDEIDFEPAPAQKRAPTARSTATKKQAYVDLSENEDDDSDFEM